MPAEFELYELARQANDALHTTEYTPEKLLRLPADLLLKLKLWIDLMRGQANNYPSD